jgi:hypothetical protein
MTFSFKFQSFYFASRLFGTGYRTASPDRYRERKVRLEAEKKLAFALKDRSLMMNLES